MKKSVFFLLAVMLLAGSSFAGPKQASQPLSALEANEILAKIAGDWNVELTTWNPESKTFKRSTGKANVRTSHLNDYVHEQFTVREPDGKYIQGESFMRYCNEKSRFEVVQMDNSGNGVVMMTGKWYPENNTLIFRQTEAQEEEGNKKDKGMVHRYTFLGDGTVSKMTHKMHKNRKYFLASVCNYVSPATAQK